MNLIEALELRIPKVKDKQQAYTKLKEHYKNGLLSAYEAQRFTDMLFPIMFDENDNPLNERTIFNADDYKTELEKLQEIVDKLLIDSLGGV